MSEKVTAYAGRDWVSYEMCGFNVKITKSDEKVSYNLVSIIDDDPSLMKIYNRIVQDVITKFEKLLGDWVVSSLDLIRLLRAGEGLASQIMSNYCPQPPANLTIALAKLVSFELAGLKPLMPLLIDKKVKKISLNTSDGVIFLEHCEYGKCSTNITVSPLGIEKFGKWIWNEAGQPLNGTLFDIRTELTTPYFHIIVHVTDHPFTFTSGSQIFILKVR